MNSDSSKKSLLTIVGLHERKAIDQLLKFGLGIYHINGYDELVLTGTGDALKPMSYVNGFVPNELRYMAEFFDQHEVPVAKTIRSLTLLGNIRQVLRNYQHQQADITFAVDQSQVYRAQELILPFFNECYPLLPDAQIIAPEKSFRKESYRSHASRMDKLIYEKGLSNPLTRKFVEYTLGTNNPVLEFLAKRKNKKLLKKELESQIGAVHTDYL